MRASVEGVLPAWDDHPARGYILGCHAFTLEETGEFARAERIGREGVALAPDDAWGLHAVAHVYDSTGRARAGLDWLTGREACLGALQQLPLSRLVAPRADASGPWANMIRHWRSMTPISAPKRPTTIATSQTQPRFLRGWNLKASMSATAGRNWPTCPNIALTDGCLAFADLHYMLALCGGERDQAAAGLIARMQATRPAGHEAQRVIAHPGLHVAQGLQAFAAGEYSVAWMHLRAGRADLQQIGGSHAQRDVFDRITIEAALRGGYADAADGPAA